ncbi:unnamed protein product [Pedinophyceae sp. YPF-701]|nr:unnamed protein product [Pedinophyceae sp. YPF-701]
MNDLRGEDQHPAADERDVFEDVDAVGIGMADEDDFGKDAGERQSYVDAIADHLERSRIAEGRTTGQSNSMFPLDGDEDDQESRASEDADTDAAGGRTGTEHERSIPTDPLACSRKDRSQAPDSVIFDERHQPAAISASLPAHLVRSKPAKATSRPVVVPSGDHDVVADANIDEAGFVPPHIITGSVADASQLLSCSYSALKGRAAFQLRQEVLRQTGFLENGSDDAASQPGNLGDVGAPGRMSVITGFRVPGGAEGNSHETSAAATPDGGTPTNRPERSSESGGLEGAGSASPFERDAALSSLKTVQEHEPLSSSLGAQQWGTGGAIAPAPA